MGKKKEGGSNLGRSLIKDRFGKKNKRGSSMLHTSELQDNQDYGRLNLQSITESTQLDEFLLTAQMADTDFTAEKSNAKVVKAKNKMGILSVDEKARMEIAQLENKASLRIPRRPRWDRSMDAKELDALERESYLKWRRQLAALQETENIILTPYEKNIQFWRQLWRVIERSDVVIQIVDARDPLLFFCEDLQNHVKEVGFNKLSLLLINKADFLTEVQMAEWVKYFTKQGVDVLFYSAIQEELDDIEEEDETEENEKHSDDDSEDEEEEEQTQENIEPAKAKDEVKEDNIPEAVEPEVFDVDDYINVPKLLSRKELANVFEFVHTGPKINESHVTIGLVGYPNVGKSSTINNLMKEKKVSVSATPGKTKHFQTMFLTDKLVLCDCPGLVFPGFVSTKEQMVVSGILSIDMMRDHIGPINQVLAVIPRKVLELTYGLNLPSPGATEDPNRLPTAEEFLHTYGYARSYMTHKGHTDKPRSARYILKDFIMGLLLYCHAPPGVDQASFHVPEVMKSRKLNQRVQIAKKPPGGHRTAEEALLDPMIGTNKAIIDPRFSRAHIKMLGKKSNQYEELDKPFSEQGAKPWRVKTKPRKQKLRKVYGYMDE